MLFLRSVFCSINVDPFTPTPLISYWPAGNALLPTMKSNGISATRRLDWAYALPTASSKPAKTISSCFFMIPPLDGDHFTLQRCCRPPPAVFIISKVSNLGRLDIKQSPHQDSPGL